MWLTGHNVTDLTRQSRGACYAVDEMIITSNLWMLLSLAAGSIIGAGLGTFVGTRRRAAVRSFADSAFKPPPGDDLHGTCDILTIEEAERQLALVYRRLRAYLRNPYDFEGAKIKDEAGFDHCLDLAASLNIRISDLGGAVTPPGEEGRQQVRQQILEGLASRVHLEQRQSGYLQGSINARAKSSA